MNSIQGICFFGLDLGQFRLLWCFVLMGICCFAGISEGKILHVPSEYHTIQSAINAASNGDEVVVADGTYTGDGNKNLDFLGKAITVRSENGPDNCIIDCEKNGRGFYFHSGEDSDSVLKGFTIYNGYVDGSWPENSGGGIFCKYSSPMIQNNIITKNSALYSGGGIFCFESSSTILNNAITENSSFLGGGIYCFKSSPMIDNNTIALNVTSSHGGGISCSDYSYPTIINNTITGNTGNTVTGAGGGIDCYHYASPTIINNIITENSAGSGGGIFCFDSSFPTITNNTIVRNFARRGGSGILCGRFASPTVVNTILWNRGDEVYLEVSSITITYSDVQGGYEGEGNIDAVPMFLSLGNGDYHLRPTSPCIGAGTNVGAPLLDKDGNPRPNPPRSNCDIGAYESRLGQPRGANLAPKMTTKLSSTWGEIKQEHK